MFVKELLEESFKNPKDDLLKIQKFIRPDREYAQTLAYNIFVIRIRFNSLAVTRVRKVLEERWQVYWLQCCFLFVFYLSITNGFVSFLFHSGLLILRFYVFDLNEDRTSKYRTVYIYTIS